MFVIKDDSMKVPLKIWHSQGQIEDQCIEQMKQVCRLPFLGHHVSLMPDGHWGKGSSIGSVTPTKGVIVPSKIGVDIGCGMCSITSNIQDWTTDDLKAVLKQIRFDVPVGFGRHLKPKPENKLPDNTELFNSFADDNIPVTSKFLEQALFQIGTLGGGNHFIELQKNPDGNLCVMIHSGSRNIGKQVADHYNNLAKELNNRYFSSVLPEWDLAFLPLDTEEGQNYVKEMEYCVEFALANRMEMMEQCKQALYKIFKPKQTVEFNDFVNIAHNYARLENHFGENVMVHRKGATSARKGEVGIIPGSQGSKSYIVLGKGNKDSFESCSHGAGRKMGRKFAQKTLDIAKETAKLDAMGVIHAIRNEKDLDEAPGSYKDIDIVMSEQTDLVDIIEERHPLAVIKG